jgi:hypothetical protein
VDAGTNVRNGSKADICGSAVDTVYAGSKARVIQSRQVVLSQASGAAQMRLNLDWVQRTILIPGGAFLFAVGLFAASKLVGLGALIAAAACFFFAWTSKAPGGAE